MSQHRAQRLQHWLTSERFWAAFTSTYVPRPLPPWSGVVLSWILALVGVARGIDLLASPESTSPIVSAVDLLGQEFWSYALLLSSLALVVGLGTRRLGPIFFMHLLCMMVNLSYGLATLQGVIESGYGLRFALPMLGSAAVYLVRLATLLPDVGPGKRDLDGSE